ncbi:MAG TPA: hypothetical protein VGM27_19190 [Acidobacteriaceae bacterium]
MKAPGKRSPEENLAFLLYLLGLIAQPVMSFVFWSRTWDDCAITLGFARSFALGGKIEPTPGSGIVEGYSTTLWMLLMAAVARISANPYWLLGVAKISTMLLNVLNVVLVRRFVARYQPAALAWLIAGAFGLQNITIYESINGMEGPLSLALFLLVVINLRRDGWRPSVTFCAAGALFLLTRWEAAWLLVPLLVLERPFKTMIAAAITWAAVFLGSNFVRWRYFGSVLPNTIIAKSGPPYSHVSPRGEFSRHIAGATLAARALFPFILVLAVLMLFNQAEIVSRLRRLARTLRSTSVLALLDRCLDLALSLSLLVFGGVLAVAVGVNWGPPNRELFTVWPILLYLILFPAWKLASWKHRSWQFPLAVLVIMLGSMGVLSKDLARADAPVYMPYTTVNNTAHIVPAIDRVRTAASQPDLLFAGPDMGGLILYANHVRIIDTALLLDPTLARTRYAGFRHYIFDLRRPDILESHAAWTELPDLVHDQQLYDAYQVLYVGDYRFFIARQLLSEIPGNRLIHGRFDANGRPEFDRSTGMGPRGDLLPDNQINRRFGHYFVLREDPAPSS